MRTVYRPFYLGTRHDGERVLLNAPSFDCGWYWSFGYLRTKHEHYHLREYLDLERFVDHFKELNPALDIENGVWTFLEIAKTIYTLKETAEVLGRGGSHIKKNPEVKRINEVVLPGLFSAMENLMK